MVTKIHLYYFVIFWIGYILTAYTIVKSRKDAGIEISSMDSALIGALSIIIGISMTQAFEFILICGGFIILSGIIATPIYIMSLLI